MKINQLNKYCIILSLFFIQAYSNAQNALNFDGINDYVQTSYSGISGSNSRTVEAWIKTTANADPNSGGIQQVITDWGTFVTGGRFTFNVLWNNAIRLEAGGNGLSGSITVNDGGWHHVAVTYNSSETDNIKLYVDGVLDVQGNLTVSVSTGSSIDMRIGRRIDDINLFEGSIDEVRVYNYAKSQEEILADMSAELCEFDEGLEAYYTFNQGIIGADNSSETTLYDMSGNENNGIIAFFSMNGTSSNWVEGADLNSGFTMSNISESTCESYYWEESDSLYESSGLYQAIIENSGGCDSIITLDLNIVDDLGNTENISACEEYLWEENGFLYSESGIYSVLYESVDGCDSLISLDLTIGLTTEGEQDVTVCESYFWEANETTYNVGGTYTALLINEAGCDSTATLNLSLVEINTSVLGEGTAGLTADQFGLEYQWLDCNDDMALISGETNMSFFPSDNGSYAVQLSLDGCSDTSDCYEAVVVGINEYGIKRPHIYPNPNSGILNIDVEEEVIEIRLIDPFGQTIQVFEGVNISPIQLQNYPNGLYLVEIKTNSAVIQRRLILQK